MKKSYKKRSLNNIKNHLDNYNVNDVESALDEEIETVETQFIEQQNEYKDSIKSYLKELSQYNLLTFEEEKDLSKKIQANDKDALNQLINCNLRLVIKIAKGFNTKGYPLIDIIQDGNLGLIRAAQKYDYRKNVRFSTYAGQWIKQMIIRAISQKRRMVRLPYRKEKALRKINQASNQFMTDHRRYPTTSELSDLLGISPKEIQNSKLSDYSISSLEENLSDNENFALENVVGDSIFNPDETLIRKDLEGETNEILDSLYPKERMILIHRFGLTSNEKYTLKEMGTLFGISAETVRQIESRTLKRIEENYSYMKDYIAS